MNDISITPLVTPDIYKALYDYVSIFATPILPPDNIIIGWQNRHYLPPNTNEYAVITVIDTKRRGTNTHEWYDDIDVPDNSIVKEMELVESGIQIDFCSNNDNAEKRSRSIELITRSEFGVNFLKTYNIAPLYADGTRDISFVDQSEQYVRRFMTTVYISYWVNTTISVSSFTNAGIYLENVDVEHH